VAYTHGQQIDQPLSITRLGYADVNGTWNGPFTVVPLWTLRGYADTSYFAEAGAQNCLALGTGTRCVAVNYPAEYWMPPFRASPIPPAFHGSLLIDKADASGQLFRRNRYYDPATGRFTQEDPIGLAGGLNLYGFANGDPVSFSDPFGLWPDWMNNFLEGMHAVTSVEGGSCKGYACTFGAVVGLATMMTPAGGVEERAVAGLAEEARFIPNPGGKLGSAAHRAVIQETADALEAEGATIVAGGGRLAERAIRVGNGKIRFPDIEAVRADGSRVFVNVGRMTKAGNPVAREGRALNDLKGTGVETLFVPYTP
jgi:RHS repeat-associated protein